MSGSDGVLPDWQIMLGAPPSKEPPQYGILGRIETPNRKGFRTAAINLNDPSCITLVGQPGAGKSYTLGTILEMATTPCPGINVLPAPLCAMQFHYGSVSHPPEFVSMVAPNQNRKEVDLLVKNFTGRRDGKDVPISTIAVPDIIMLAPPAMVKIRQAEYPHIAVHPLAFHPAELAGTHWKFLLGAVGDGSIGTRLLKDIIRTLDMKKELSIANIEEGIKGSLLEDVDKRLARIRLMIAGRFIDEQGPGIGSYVKPGRLIIVDARDEFIEKSEIFAILIVLLEVFADANPPEKTVNKLVVFDEAHQYMVDEDLIDGLISLIRVMRHRRTTICVASQDPLSIPQRVIELSKQIIIHRMNSPKWLKHLKESSTALEKLTPLDVAELTAGQAFVWTESASEPYFTETAFKMEVRPRFSHHGGFTKSAVGDPVPTASAVIATTAASK